MLKAVIFDMDGVLIDSEPLHTKAAINVMKNFGVSISPDYCSSFIGSTDKHMFEVLRKEYQLTYSIDEFLNENKCEKNKLLQPEGYPPIPYIRDLIIDLANNGLKLAIASSSPMEAIKQTAITLDINQYFQQYASGMEVNNPKPAPDVFLKACTLLNISPSEAIIIEDSYNGIKAAKSAGIACVGFYNPNSGNQDLSDADIIVEGFEEVDYHFIKNIYERSIGIPLTILNTERLSIKEISMEEYEQLYIIYNQPGVMENINDIGTLKEEIDKHQAYIKNMYHFYGYGLWGIFINNGNKLIGRCGIQNSTINGVEEYELGYLLDVDYWGNGYAIEAIKSVITYAFKTLYIDRIVAVIEDKNMRSINVAKRANMVFEKEIIHNDKSCYLYAITNDKT